MLYEITLTNDPMYRDPMYQACPAHRLHLPEIFTGAQDGIWFDRLDDSNTIWRVRCTMKQARQYKEYFKTRKDFISIKSI